MGRTVSKSPGANLESQEDVAFDPLLDDFVPKPRSYPHFDRKLSEADRSSFSTTNAALKSHDFWPLIGFKITERRAKRNENDEIIFQDKDREIKFGSHRDAAMLEWFGIQLADKYEAKLQSSGLSDVVLAYRSGLGSNIDLAKSLFDEIRKRKSCRCLAFDISGFFDNISHDELLKNWKAVLGVARLPDHEFKVFSRMTRFEWVESDKLQEALGRRKPVNGRLCTAVEFRTLVRKGDLIFQNEKALGIPQGSPLSGLLANISMLDFDRVMHAYLTKRGGSYRRYSDDIAIVLPSGVDEKLVERHLISRLKKIGLKINTKKTDRATFDLGLSPPVGEEFQYLGFVFDGARVLIRASSLNRYYKKMWKGIRAKVAAARMKGVDLNQMYLRELLRRYTHFGLTRNFPRYAYRAAAKFGSSDIRKQVAGHMRHFKRMLSQAIA